MGQSINHRRKEILESADFHLFTAIDRLYALWVDIYRQHPELGHHLTNLMADIEANRFRIQQFYHLCWGGRPGWMMQMTEITHQLRKQRADWAREVQPCQGYGNVSEDLQQKP